MKRSEAMAAGLKSYTAGKPCRHGHVAGRWTSNGRCVECSKAAFRGWHWENAEKSRAKSKNWRENNYEYHLDTARARATKRYEEKKADCLAYAKQRRGIEEVRLKENARARKWATENPDTIRAHKRRNQAVRRSRKTNAGGSFSGADLAEMFTKQSGKCAYFFYCGSEFSGAEYHIDHRMPIARGGSSFKSNLQLLCASCNMRKAARDPKEFETMIGMAV